MSTSALDPPVNPTPPGASTRDVFNRIIRSTIHFVLAQAIARIVGFVYILFLARSLPVDEFGLLNLVLTIVVLADTTADVGLSRLALRQMSQDGARTARYLGALTPLRILTSCVAFVAVVGLVWITGYPAQMVSLTAIVGLGLLFTGPTMMLESGLHAQQRFAFVSLAHVALSVVQAGSGATVLHLGGGVEALAATFALTNLLYLSIIYVGLRRLGVAVKPAIDVTFWRERLRMALPYGGVIIIFVLSMRIELLALGWFGSAAELAVYGIAAKVLEAGLLAAITLGTVLAPSFAQYHVASREKLAHLYLMALRATLLLAIPGAFAVAAVAEPLLSSLLPGNYDLAGRLLLVMLAAFPFAAVYYVNLSLLFGSDRQHRTLLLTTGLIVLQIAVNCALAPSFGARGSAVAFAISVLMAAIVSTWCVLRWILNGASVIRAAGPPLAAGLVMASAAWQYSYVLGLWTAPVAIAIFAAAAVGLTILVPLTPVSPVSESAPPPEPIAAAPDPDQDRDSRLV